MMKMTMQLLGSMFRGWEKGGEIMVIYTTILEINVSVLTLTLKYELNEYILKTAHVPYSITVRMNERIQ